MSTPEPVPVHRLPLPSDLGHDHDRLRTAVCDAMMAEIALRGRVEPAVRIFTGSELLVCPLDRVGREGALASLLSTLRDHDGVHGVFRTGVLQAGEHTRQMAILQTMKRGSWWLATCDLRREAGAWKPVAGWQVRSGGHQAALPGSFAPWVAAFPTATALTALRADTILPAGIQRLGTDAPVDPWLFSHELACGVAESLTWRPWPSDVAITVRERRIESWILPAVHVGGPEEAMRTLTTAFRVRAAALLTGERSEVDGTPFEGVRITAEAGGVRTAVRVAVSVAGPNRRLVAMEEISTVAVGPADAWIGVPPIVACYALLCGRGVHALPQA